MRAGAASAVKTGVKMAGAPPDGADALEAGRQDVLQEAGAEGGAIDEATNTPLMAELPPCTIGVPASSGHHGSTSQPQPSAARHPGRGKSGLATWHGLCVPSPRILTVWSASR